MVARMPQKHRPGRPGAALIVSRYCRSIDAKSNEPALRVAFLRVRLFRASAWRTGSRCIDLGTIARDQCTRDPPTRYTDAHGAMLVCAPKLKNVVICSISDHDAAYPAWFWPIEKFERSSQAGRCRSRATWAGRPKCVKAMLLPQRGSRSDFAIGIWRPCTMGDVVNRAFSPRGPDWRTHVDVNPSRSRRRRGVVFAAAVVLYCAMAAHSRGTFSPSAAAGSRRTAIPRITSSTNSTRASRTSPASGAATSHLARCSRATWCWCGCGTIRAQRMPRSSRGCAEAPTARRSRYAFQSGTGTA